MVTYRVSKHTRTVASRRLVAQAPVRAHTQTLPRHCAHSDSSPRDAAGTIEYPTSPQSAFQVPPERGGRGAAREARVGAAGNHAARDTAPHRGCAPYASRLRYRMCACEYSLAPFREYWCGAGACAAAARGGVQAQAPARGGRGGGGAAQGTADSARARARARLSVCVVCVCVTVCVCACACEGGDGIPRCREGGRDASPDGTAPML